MSDKPVAYLTTCVICAPIVTACCLPFFYPAIFTWIWAQLAGFGPLAATGLAIFVGLLTYRYFRRRKKYVIKENDPKGGTLQAQQQASVNDFLSYQTKEFIKGVDVRIPEKK